MPTAGTVARRTALALAGLTALAGIAAVALVLMPPPTWEAWQYALLALEFSLFAALVAAFGAALALAARPGNTRLRAVLVSANALVLAAALVPSAALWSTARDLGADLSLSDHTAGLSTVADREPTTLTYATVDGTALELDVWEPAEPSAEPLPVVVNVHGGADDLSQSLLPRWDTWLADEGHVVVEADYRFFPEGEWSAPVSDVRCALGWVRDHIAEYGGDPERIALTGQSAGGFLALLAAWAPAEDIPPSCPAPEVDPDAVIAWYTASIGTVDAPPSPWRLRHSPLGGELAATNEHMMGGTVDEVPEEYTASSPVEHVRPGLPPALLLTAGHDLFLDPEDNRRLAARLSGAGVAHRHVELPWTEHMYDLNWGGFASQITRHEIGAFLTEHLHP
ncbi:alpha/beta hydrolase [Nocardiopsis sp. HNM0947]|uniref:Alpha/beta hydrolase n=1 Tax=Nocardiopsis coralli TaxID=2772213 RepID=A0ABR9P4T3_9ACTN|nr:alpha/beta hydrolase [Nocardiopsis coralli]MBE2998852.1 alpha/beta hydrolase [Nocardiopsis coralli]